MTLPHDLEQSFVALPRFYARDLCMPPSYLSRRIHTFSNMGWLRLVGSLKLQVSFAKEPYKRDYILQKRPIILRSLLIVATPYTNYSRDT